MSRTVPDGIRVAGFVQETNKIDGVTFDLIADVVRKWPAVLAGKTVRTDVITSFPTDDSPDSVFDSFVEIAAESV